MIQSKDQRHRLDVLLVERGLVETRARARALILARQISVDNEIESKAGAQISLDAHITLIEPQHPYVGRGGIKLAHALDRFDVEISGQTVLDIGASTGGFTDVMLRRGAAHVIALDVGRGQLDWKLRVNPHVTTIEGTNARYLTRDSLPTGGQRVNIVTLDVSFISLRLILPVIPDLLIPDGSIIALVKPQFEASRREIGKGGVVRDPKIHTRVIKEVTTAANALGFTRVATTPSPILGAAGNREFFMHLRKRN